MNLTKQKELYEKLKEYEKGLKEEGIEIGNGALKAQIENKKILESYTVPLEESKIEIHLSIKNVSQVDLLQRSITMYSNNENEMADLMKTANKLGVTNAIVKECANIPCTEQKEYLEGFGIMEKFNFCMAVFTCMSHFLIFCQVSDYIKKERINKEDTQHISK